LLKSETTCQNSIQYLVYFHPVSEKHVKTNFNRLQF